MGFFALTAAGGGFILIGAWESISASEEPTQISDPSSHLSQYNDGVTTTTKMGSVYAKQETETPCLSSSSFLNFVMIALISFMCIANSLASVFNALDSNDRVGSALQLQILAVASLFLFYSVLGLLMSFNKLISLPSLVLDLIVLFGFVEEFLIFYLQRKDTSGIENRYFDLLLVPILICVVGTILELGSKKSGSNYARLARGIGLILQGMWFLQMGLSFYTGLITHGCSLHGKSQGNYTIKCKGHPEYHRARSIATLQFNCHLSLLVILCMVWYSIMAKKNEYRGGDFMHYRPLGAEMQQMEISGHFTLDSDEDDIREEDNLAKMNVEVGVNGHGSHEVNGSA
ncbi:hypothetical protein Dsin_007380 [Dipteronia sinensis]|uniref:Uncharacterized protein n=1 Tax=Dipteronia sinensis TaxID=43782 RepID=A0AAE0B004_9ROSI|nr:hypothetical protein Dsin_007380 [Dipteronia sinensis]